MLTKEQLQRFAQRSGIGLQALERDYIQHLLLSALFTRGPGLVFKGGTALRVLHRSPRYSEDLDFNATLKLTECRSLCQRATADLARFGVMAALRNEWRSEAGWSFDLSFQGPLYDGRDHSKGKIRIDVNIRREKASTERRLVSPEYDDIVPFLLTALTAEHLLAEKVRALLVRGKARDVYDLWFLIEQGASVNFKLLGVKLSLYETRFELSALEKRIDAVRSTWRRDLHPLLAQAPEFSAVRNRLLHAFTATTTNKATKGG